MLKLHPAKTDDKKVTICLHLVVKKPLKLSKRKRAQQKQERDKVFQSSDKGMSEYKLLQAITLFASIDF